jgi:hypothetical protein
VRAHPSELEAAGKIPVVFGSRRCWGIFLGTVQALAYVQSSIQCLSRAADKFVLDREGSMAGKRAKPVPLVRKKTVGGASVQPARRQMAVVVISSADPRRLLREAAWSQMFGRVASKNPFTAPA